MCIDLEDAGMGGESSWQWPVQSGSFLQGGPSRTRLREHREGHGGHTAGYSHGSSQGVGILRQKRRFYPNFTLPYCLACFHEHVILKAETKQSGRGMI